MILQRSFQSTSIALACSITFVSAKASLYLALSGSEYIDAVEDFRVVATLTNTGDETLRILNDPRSALSDMPTDIFTISNEVGDSPIFTGIAAKYVPKVAIAIEDYTTLIPGQSIDVEHDLASRYDFSSSGESVYTIHPSNVFNVIDPFNPNDVVAFHADYDAPYIARISQMGIMELFDQGYFNITAGYDNMDIDNKMGPSFVGCSKKQQSLIKAATVPAQKYVSKAYAFLQANQGNNKRYNTWFGKFDSTRYNTVLRAFKTINGNNYWRYTYDCSTCHKKPSTFAYVHPDKFGTVYLCKAFWRAHLTGTDSKGGTIVHESSHFTKNGGTKDKAYGHSKCKQLAKDDPGNAIHNADSYEYFSENTP